MGDVSLDQGLAGDEPARALTVAETPVREPSLDDLVPRAAALRSARKHLADLEQRGAGDQVKAALMRFYRLTPEDLDADVEAPLPVVQSSNTEADLSANALKRASGKGQGLPRPEESGAVPAADGAKGEAGCASDLKARLCRLFDRAAAKTMDDLELAEAVLALRIPKYPEYKGAIPIPALAALLAANPPDVRTLNWLASQDFERICRLAAPAKGLGGDLAGKALATKSAP